jgi:hypothetical protein
LIQPRPVLSLGFVSSNSSRPDNHMRSTYSYLQMKHLKCITIWSSQGWDGRDLSTCGKCT